VGDDGGGAPGEQRDQGGLDRQFGDAVEMRGGFVEDEDSRVFEEDPVDGEALLFPSAEAVAPLADQGAVAVREAGDEVVDERRPDRSLDLVVGGVRRGVEQIVPNGGMKQERIREHHADWRA
jgi:hypothetical protein